MSAPVTSPLWYSRDGHAWNPATPEDAAMALDGGWLVFMGSEAELAAVICERWKARDTRRDGE